MEGDKHPNGKYRPRSERPARGPEEVRRLIEERMRQQAVPPLGQSASAGALRLVAFGLFRALVVEELIRAREQMAEEALGIPQGNPNAPGSWEALEKMMGKEAMDRVRRGE